MVWSNVVAADTAPATVNIPDSSNGMGGSGLTNEYFSNAWYELQMLLNDGGHQHRGRGPVDFVYVAGHERELERWSGRSEPGRVLVTVIAAMQSTGRGIGPQDKAKGWQPDQTIDPRMMVAAEWSETFAGLAAEERRAITQAWLTAWLEKCTSYPVVKYFHLSQLPGSYEPPKELRAISGGKVRAGAHSSRQSSHALEAQRSSILCGNQRGSLGLPAPALSGCVISLRRVLCRAERGGRHHDRNGR